MNVSYKSAPQYPGGGKIIAEHRRVALETMEELEFEWDD